MDPSLKVLQPPSHYGTVAVGMQSCQLVTLGQLTDKPSGKLAVLLLYMLMFINVLRFNVQYTHYVLACQQ